jgi:dTMP kinase
LLPDRTLLFVLDPQVALQRMKSRREREKFERLEFLRLVDENFRRMAAFEPERFVQIDADQDAKEVAEEAINAILDLISKGI